jgi:hypothetical protein
MGLITRQANVRVIREIVMSWVLTLPVAGRRVLIDEVSRTVIEEMTVACKAACMTAKIIY